MNQEAFTNQLLRHLQQDFPLCEKPFAQLANELGVDENSLIEQVRCLKSCGIIRRISGTFNLRKFGYHMALVAFDVAPDKMHIAANVLVEQPAVSHCYVRQDNDFAIWFTLALPERLDEQVASLANICKARRVLNLPATQHFKLSTMFDMETGCVLESPAEAEKTQPLSLTPELKKIIHALQTSINISHKPFDGPAKTVGVSTDELFRGAEILRKAGLLRRYSAVIDHAAAGIVANALVTWQTNPVEEEHAGILASLNPHVSHCYARKTCDGWPYNLYTMIHARTQKKLDEVICELAATLGNPP
ncbi:MAG TPA: hypothetical protein PKK48_03730, partial [Phycisphaerae bacterium]|nr:hypothetical protein [Phycisphaerae bacterium]